MKILMASYAFYPQTGGIETMSMQFAEEFVRAGHCVKVVTPVVSDKEDCFPYDVIRNPKPAQLLTLLRWSDVYFHNNICLQLAWPLLLVRRPWVVAHHTWIRRGDGSLGVQDRIKRFVLRFATGISISRAVQEHLETPSLVIGNSYQNDNFYLVEGVARDKELVFVGRLVADKGVDVLLRSLAELKESGRRLTLTIIGDGTERAHLETLSKTLGLTDQVEFVGKKTGQDLNLLLNQHRFIIIPSSWEEPFGLVALEGIACGCIAIGSDAGGLPDAIGPCGAVFKRGDSHSLAEVITQSFEDRKQQEIWLAAAPDHLAKHSPATVAGAYINLFEKAVKQFHRR